MSGVEQTRIDTDRNFLDVLDRVHALSAEVVDQTHVFTLSQVYEGLLLKMGEKGNDGGQFFTPREVIRVVVRAIDPKVAETVYDPGCGTGGFLAQAYEHMTGPDHAKIGSPDQLEALKHRTFFGREKDLTIYPIALVKTNLLFFTKGQSTERIWYYDLSDVKVGKKSPLTLEKFEEFFRLLPARGGGEHSWTVTRAEIDARGYDLKAVNPNAKKDEDTRTPEELLDTIEAKGREVAESITALRKLL